MSKPIIEVHNLSKVYRLGEIGMTSLRESAERTIRRLKHHFSRRAGTKGDRDLGEPEGDFSALSGVSFEVQPGEVLGIIGENGAGKSTLLKILSRITEPSSGEIRLRGRIAALLEVGTGFHPELTGRENIYLNGTILGMKKREIDRKLEEIIDFSGIEKHIDTPVKRYSSGMNVRLGFAVAAHLEPEILVVDEVLAVGDADFQNKCIKKMQDVAGDGRTVLFVSHNMASISRLTKRCVVLEKGGVTFDGPTPEAVDIYFNKGRDANVACLDAAHLPRLPFGSGAATITKLAYPNQGNPIPLGGMIEISLGVKALKELEKLQFQLTVLSVSGEPVGTASSRDFLDLRENEEQEIALQMKNHGLTPGIYHCDLALITGDQFDRKFPHEVIPRAFKIEILATMGPENRVAIWKQVWGSISLPNLEVAPLVEK